MKSVVLLSGGLDSCVMAAMAKEEGEVIALSFDYQQRHRHELDAATLIAHHLNIQHQIVPLLIPSSSALTDKSQTIVKNRLPEEMVGIPSTYVPARNTLFLSYAVSFAESLGASQIMMGANLHDRACYPDCSPAFFTAFNALLQVALKDTSINVKTPLIHLTKKEIILEGLRLQAPISLSFSCYDPHNNESCGRCDACVLRAQGFEEAYRSLRSGSEKPNS
ncbi:MAG: 7-cyano-7-deazaguanine synthase QueC [Chlamydiota bacterium]